MDLRDGDGEEDGETLHPRVKDELDRLNLASDEINRLENELDEARSRFSSTRNDSTHRLNALAGKIKSSVIKKARPYYEAKEKAKKAQEEALKAARQFQSANGIHRAAKETISLAEQKLCQEESVRVLSSEWQEMFNHATIRLMEAEKEKRRSDEEHQMKSWAFSEAEKHMQVEEKKHKRSIARARPYFEVKTELQTKLELLKVAVEALHDAVTHSKRKYAEALSSLELISNQVHEQRKGKLVLHMPREPGVGAESANNDSGGVTNLRTSFDDPDTPGSEGGSSMMPRDKFDVIHEEEDDVEEDCDVIEGSSDVSVKEAPVTMLPAKESACSASEENRTLVEIADKNELVQTTFSQQSSPNKEISELPINADNCEKTSVPNITQESLHNKDLERPAVIGDIEHFVKADGIPQASLESTESLETCITGSTPPATMDQLQSADSAHIQKSNLTVTVNSQHMLPVFSEKSQKPASVASSQESTVTDSSHESRGTDSSHESRGTDSSHESRGTDSSHESRGTDSSHESAPNDVSHGSTVTYNSHEPAPTDISHGSKVTYNSSAEADFSQTASNTMDSQQDFRGTVNSQGLKVSYDSRESTATHNSKVSAAAANLQESVVTDNSQETAVDFNQIPSTANDNLHRSTVK